MGNQYAAEHAKAFKVFFKGWWKKHPEVQKAMSEYNAECMAMDFWLARGEWDEQQTILGYSASPSQARG